MGRGVRPGRVALPESFLHGTLVYFAMVVLIRIILRRQRGGSVGFDETAWTTRW